MLLLKAIAKFKWTDAQDFCLGFNFHQTIPLGLRFTEHHNKIADKIFKIKSVKTYQVPIQRRAPIYLKGQ